MLPIRILQFIMNSPGFHAHMDAKNINPNICLGIKMRRVYTEEFLYYDVYFDYGKPDLDSKDIAARVKIVDDDLFVLLQITPL